MFAHSLWHLRRRYFTAVHE